MIKVGRWGEPDIPQEYLESMSELIVRLRKIASSQESNARTSLLRMSRLELKWVKICQKFFMKFQAKHVNWEKTYIIMEQLKSKELYMSGVLSICLNSSRNQLLWGLDRRSKIIILNMKVWMTNFNYIMRLYHVYFIFERSSEHIE